MSLPFGIRGPQGHQNSLMETIMNKYKLIGSSHTDVTTVRGKDVTTEYKTGDVIESAVDLVARFPGKFELVTSD